MKQFVTDYEALATEQETGVKPADQVIEFELDGRVMKAHPPTEGQLAFMLAALGRGQTDESRFASIINVMVETLDKDDRDYFESRLLTSDPKRRLPAKQIEAIFEYLTEQWFARPTQSQSDSAGSQQNDGTN